MRLVIQASWVEVKAIEWYSSLVEDHVDFILFIFIFIFYFFELHGIKLDPRKTM